MVFFPSGGKTCSLPFSNSPQSTRASTSSSSFPFLFFPFRSFPFLSNCSLVFPIQFSPSSISYVFSLSSLLSVPQSNQLSLYSPTSRIKVKMQKIFVVPINKPSPFIRISMTFLQRATVPLYSPTHDAPTFRLHIQGPKSYLMHLHATVCEWGYTRGQVCHHSSMILFY